MSEKISIAKYFGHGNDKLDFEPGHVRPALLMERLVEAALDAWVDNNEVTIKLVPEECETWVAFSVVKNQDVSVFAIDSMSNLEDTPVQEIWLSKAALQAMDSARRSDADDMAEANQEKDCDSIECIECGRDMERSDTDMYECVCGMIAGKIPKKPTER